MIELFKTFKVAVCGCGHDWTTEAKHPRCSACEKRLQKRKKRYALHPVPMEEPDHSITVYRYWAVRNPFK